MSISYIKDKIINIIDLSIYVFKIKEIFSLNNIIFSSLIVYFKTIIRYIKRLNVNSNDLYI